MNKKLLIILIAVLFVIGVVVAVVLINKDKENTLGNNPGVSNESDIRVTGKLKTYLESLGENYYIKYSGKFKNEAGEELDAIVEFTKRKEDYAIKSNELELQMVKEGDVLSSVSNRYKMIVKIRPTSFDISSYNLLADIGQTYVKTSTENVDSKNYEVEEYLYNNETLKYYFLDGDIKRIVHNGKEVKVLRVEKNVNTLLFELPKDYTIVNS